MCASHHRTHVLHVQHLRWSAEWNDENRRKRRQDAGGASFVGSLYVQISFDDLGNLGVLGIHNDLLGFIMIYWDL